MTNPIDKAIEAVVSAALFILFLGVAVAPVAGLVFLLSGGGGAAGLAVGGLALPYLLFLAVYRTGVLGGKPAVPRTPAERRQVRGEPSETRIARPHGG